MATRARATRRSLPDRFGRHLDERPDLIPQGSHVLVALSGGPDSTALLHLLAGRRGERELTLTAAHFDHALREESAEEAERVRARAGVLDVPCRVAGPSARLSPDQESFREARYAFLEAVARETAADRIATGHQADDQAETVLFRILRGTGVRGLRGIPERRGRIVRPLLPFWSDEIEAYLEGRGVEVLRDPSNRDPRWARTRIRTRVLPALEEAWDGPVRERLVALARSAEEADRALTDRARRLLQRAVVGRGGPWGESAYELRRDPLREADPETRARAVRILARRLGVRLTRGGTRAAIEFISEGRSGGSVDIGDDLQLAREFARFWVGRPRSPSPDRTLTIEPGGAGRGTARLGGRRVSVRWETRAAGGATERGGDVPDGRGGPDEAVGRSADGSAGRIALPTARIRFPLRLRAWRDGDRIRLARGTRKLKRVFNDRRVPLSRRGRVPTLVSADGRTLWVEGVGRDVERVPEAGEEILLIEVYDA